ncbi:MAG: hypothetical protein QM760_22810 [Nibricoccus sp.]
MRLTLSSKVFSNDALSSADYAGGMSASRTFWQYQGINLSDQKGPYGQKRVIVGNDGVIGPSLFQPVIPPAPISKTIIPGMVLSLPLALPLIGPPKAIPDELSAFERLQSQLATIDSKLLKAEDWRVRITDVAVVWNVFQHFHPYLDGAGIDWTGALEPGAHAGLG